MFLYTICTPVSLKSSLEEQPGLLTTSLPALMMFKMISAVVLRVSYWPRVKIYSIDDMYVFVRMHTCVRVCTRPYHSMTVEVSGQPLKADSLYPVCGSQGSNSGLVANILNTQSQLFSHSLYFMFSQIAKY